MYTRNIFVIAFSAIIIMLMAGCKKSNQDTQQLQQLVEQINTNPGTELANGLVLSKCEYKDGDSIFTYYVKVEDKRFDEISQEALKDTVFQKLTSPKQQKLLNVFIKNNINLQYIFDTNSKTIPIVFSSDELQKSLNQTNK